jgi:hypothetical protein
MTGVDIPFVDFQGPSNRRTVLPLRFARPGDFAMSLLEHNRWLVWPVAPAHWNQAGENWVGEIKVPSGREPARAIAVTVKLPDGRLVHYEGVALGCFLDDWQFKPSVILDFQI